MEGFKQVQLWYVKGIPGQYFLLKLDCETAARKAFPNEGAQKNYARVYYTIFYQEE